MLKQKDTINDEQYKEPFVDIDAPYHNKKKRPESNQLDKHVEKEKQRQKNGAP